MNKKGDGLTLNVIIIAALGLLVLVILAVIFTGRAGMFRVESGKCDVYGGTCQRTACLGDYQKQAGYDCDLDGDGTVNEAQTIDGICCVSVGK